MTIKWSNTIEPEEQIQLIEAIEADMSYQLARQLKVLAEKDYRPQKLEVWDEIYGAGAEFRDSTEQQYEEDQLLWTVEGWTCSDHHYKLELFDLNLDSDYGWEVENGKVNRYVLVITGDFEESLTFWPKTKASIERTIKRLGGPDLIRVRYELETK